MGMDDSDLPSVVILSSNKNKLKDIIKGILDVESLPLESKLLCEGVIGYPWEVNNKYYSASVNLCTFDYPQNVKSWIHQHGEALVFYCQDSEKDALKEVDAILSGLSGFEPEVQLLVCDSCVAEGEDGIGLSRLEAQQWCIKNGWELIEVNRDLNSKDSDEEEEAFPESWGYKRIRQALHAHTWSNLVMKDTRGTNKQRGADILKSFNGLGNSSDEETEDNEGYMRLSDLAIDDSKQSSNSDNDRQRDGSDPVDPTLYEDYFGGGEGEVGSTDFDKLFSNFKHLQ